MGAPIGVLLIGAAVCAIALAVDSTVSVSTHKGGIAGNIALAAGASESEAGKADMGFQISLSALGAIFSVGAGAAGLLAAGKAALSAGFSAMEVGEAAGASGAEVGGEAGTAGAEAGGEAGATASGTTTQTIKAVAQAMKEAFMASLRESSENIGQTARLAQRAAATGQDATQIGSSATDIGKGVVQYQSEQLRADAKKKEAESKAHQAQVEMLEAVIDKAISLLVDEGNRFGAILDSVTDAMKDRGDSLSRVRFAG